MNSRIVMIPLAILCHDTGGMDHGSARRASEQPVEDVGVRHVADVHHGLGEHLEDARHLPRVRGQHAYLPLAGHRAVVVSGPGERGEERPPEPARTTGEHRELRCR